MQDNTVANILRLLGDRPVAWLAREAGYPGSTLRRKLAGGRLTVTDVARLGTALAVPPALLLDGAA